MAIAFSYAARTSGGNSSTLEYSCPLYLILVLTLIFICPANPLSPNYARRVPGRARNFGSIFNGATTGANTPLIEAFEIRSACACPLLKPQDTGKEVL